MKFSEKYELCLTLSESQYYEPYKRKYFSEGGDEFSEKRDESLNLREDESGPPYVGPDPQLLEDPATRRTAYPASMPRG